jgi:predicted nuclease of predicted toxin-antitoxin system
MMNFLIDQDVYYLTIQHLKKLGFDIVTTRDLNLQRASDERILKKAKELKRILITRDKDFGALTFLRGEVSTGVILLKITPLTLDEVHLELERVLKEHSFKELRNRFCVIEPHRHRIRKLPGRL